MRHRKLFRIVCYVYNMRNIFSGGLGNRLVDAPFAFLNNVRIRISGKNNTVLIEDFSKLRNCTIYIAGNNNSVKIGKNCSLTDVAFHIEDDGNEIFVGDHTAICGKTHLAAIEGTRILIGRDCLFSSNIHFQTGDAHSILDMNGRRINKSADIKIGNHVWVGTKVTCLKGAHIADHCIVGACALVCGRFDETNSVLAGVPAKITRRNINWCGRRIPVGEIAAEFVDSWDDASKIV